MTAKASSAACVDLGGEVRLQRLEVVDVDGDAGLLHLGQQVDQRQLDLGQQGGAAALLELLVERLGQVEDGPGVQHRRLGAAAVVDAVEAELVRRPRRPCRSSRLR